MPIPRFYPSRSNRSSWYHRTDPARSCARFDISLDPDSPERLPGGISVAWVPPPEAATHRMFWMVAPIGGKRSVPAQPQRLRHRGYPERRNGCRFVCGSRGANGDCDKLPNQKVYKTQPNTADRLVSPAPTNNLKLMNTQQRLDYAKNVLGGPP